MANTLVLFEDAGFIALLPLVFWRSVFELQVGRKIVLDRTAQRLGLPVAGVWTRDWVARVASQRCGAPANQGIKAGTVLANGRWLCDGPVEFPPPPCVGVIGDDVAYVVCDDELAARLSWNEMLDAKRQATALSDVKRTPADGRIIRYAWDIVAGLPDLLEADWRPADAALESELPPDLAIESRERVHVGERTTIHPTVTINADAGPVYISHDVQIGALTIIEGPVYIGPGSRVHPQSWLHGANAVGAVCRVAGELHGCVINGYTNKQHPGFLGHSYVGSWVNIGAGANNSDLKNTYGKVRVPINGTPVDTGLQFFGAVIGDHVKLGINSSIPSGAAIGMAASIASTQMLPKYIPSFSWITPERMSAGDPLRLLDAASAAMARRDVDMTDDEVELFIDLGTRVRTYEKSR